MIGYAVFTAGPFPVTWTATRAAAMLKARLLRLQWPLVTIVKVTWRQPWNGDLQPGA